MMYGGKFKLISLLACNALVLFSAGSALATATGDCIGCHTMHNSDGGKSMMIDDTAEPSLALVRAGGCVGCHMYPDNDAPATVPQVNKSTAYSAAGSFYWVDSGEDNKGHNVAGLATNSVDETHTDATVPGPPGFSAAYSANTAMLNGEPAWGTNQLTCAGTSGCHGTHDAETDEFAAVKGAHHETGAIDGYTVGTSYRFLNGIMGIEDSDWEITTGPADHNVYKGNTVRNDNTTISYLCAECHGNFHSTADVGDGTTPWLRHPTDIDMRDVKYNGTEYAAYAYDVQAPAAMITPAAAADINYAAGGEAVVTCVSCHRPHGSEFDDLLRWEYSTNMDAGTTGGFAGTGCFRCHTTKDGI